MFTKMFSSIQKRHIPHRLRLAFGVHHDPMPVVKHDGLVVGMTDAALNVDARVPSHRAPAPPRCFWIASQNPLILHLGDPARMARADVNSFATRSVAELSPMRLASILTR